MYIESTESEADAYGVVDTLHDAVVEMPHLFLETLLVDSPDLLKQDNRILGKAEAVGNHVDMCREPGLADLTGYSRGYDGRAVFVSDIVLNDQHGTQPALLRAHHRT